MSLAPDFLKAQSHILTQARLQAREIPRLTEATPTLTLEDAYLIQAEGIIDRIQSGEKVVGYKMGLTSKAKREQMNLHQSIYGVITDRMEVRGEYSLNGRIHPKIEPEVAFWLEREMRGPASREDILANTRAVGPALEILDSRFVGFKYFSLPDVVADNSSSSDFVLGEPVALAEMARRLGAPNARALDLNSIELKMSVNGALSQSAPASAISGDPVISLVELCDLLHAHGITLPAGSVVLAGAATQAVMLEPGMRVDLDAGLLGSMRVQVAAK